MPTKQEVAEFISVYESLCISSRLYLAVCGDGKLGIFDLDKEGNRAELDGQLELWRSENAE